jgi:lipopolysaccharide/colanic/teichoic acid biosynthesis glycosyltransferase
MTVGAEKHGVYEAKNDVRVTRIGKLIRKLSIDELPQFVNILKGDMSIIGPRPTLTYHPWKYEEYSYYQKKRFNLRPGVTGWAQVNGRKNVEWNDRIELDVYYTENVSVMFDIKNFIKTIFRILSMKDNFNEGKTVK